MKRTKEAALQQELVAAYREVGRLRAKLRESEAREAVMQSKLRAQADAAREALRKLRRRHGGDADGGAGADVGGGGKHIPLRKRSDVREKKSLGADILGGFAGGAGYAIASHVTTKKLGGRKSSKRGGGGAAVK